MTYQSGPLCGCGKGWCARGGEGDFEGTAPEGDHLGMGDTQNLPGAHHHQLQRGGLPVDCQEDQWHGAGGEDGDREDDAGGLRQAHTHP